MLRVIVNYLNSLRCEHHYEMLAEVTEHDLLLGTTRTHQTFRCTKCGYVQRVKL